MNANKYSEALGKPFDAKDVSWRLQYIDKEKLQGFAVPYLDARAISERLDSVVGQLRWKDSYTPCTAPIRKALIFVPFSSMMMSLRSGSVKPTKRRTRTLSL